MPKWTKAKQEKDKRTAVALTGKSGAFGVSRTAGARLNFCNQDGRYDADFYNPPSIKIYHPIYGQFYSPPAATRRFYCVDCGVWSRVSFRVASAPLSAASKLAVTSPWPSGKENVKDQGPVKDP